MFTEDLSPFFDAVNGFAEAVTYQGTSQIDVIFDDAFVNVGVGQIGGVESRKPACLAIEADVPNVAHGHTILRGAVTYHVIGIEPDGTGVTLLVLEKQ